MNLRDQLKAVMTRAAELQKAAAGRDLTDEEITEAGGLPEQVSNLKAKIKAAEDAAAALKGLSATGGEPDDDEDGTPEEEDTGGAGDPKAHPKVKVKDRTDPRNVDLLGTQFVKSEAYKQFRKDNPTGTSGGTPLSIRSKVGERGDYRNRVRGRKAALDSSIAHLQPTRFPLLDQVIRPRLTLLDLIARGQADGAFEYVQVIGVTRNAAIVAEKELKPLSEIQTDIADAKPFTYADGFDVTNQLLADAPAFASYMDNELEYSLDNVVEEKLLNGTGATGQPRGLMHTTGVQEQEFDTDMVTSIRKGITKVTRVGGSVTGVLMSPEDDEKWDLLKDGNERYYSQGPFGAGPYTAWARPRAVCERLAEGTVILGDFQQIALFDVEPLSVLAFNQHKDYAQRNMVYVRGELRAVQTIWKPVRLCVVQVKPGGGN